MVNLFFAYFLNRGKSMSFKDIMSAFFAPIDLLTPRNKLLKGTAEKLITEMRGTEENDKKHAAILIIDEWFQREKEKADIGVNTLIEQLKEAIIKECNSNSSANTNRYNNWKDALLGTKYQPISRRFLQEKNIYPDIQASISLSDKQRFNSFRKSNVYTITGSSFATNNPNVLNASPDKAEGPVLDGSYTASTWSGWVMAVADGCGHGHTKEKNEDIGRTAYFACKSACRLMAGYSSAAQLNQDLFQLKKRLSAELLVKVRAHRNKSLQPQQGREEPLDRTTLACGRAFRNKDGTFRFVGFNIGDTMLIAYDPYTKSFQTIAKARQLQMIGGGSPAALPDFCKDEQMVNFDKTLPQGTIILGLTDGVWDYLPLLQNSEEDRNEFLRIDTEIDFRKLTTDPDFKLPGKVTVSKLTTAFADYSVKQTDKQRQACLKKAKAAEILEPLLQETLKNFQEEKRGIHNPEVKNIREELQMAMNAKKISVGDDYTLVGMSLSDNIDLTPDYLPIEIAASVLTLGLYALIKDTLRIGTNDEISIKDGFVAAAKIVGFFATGSLLGVGYLAYKGLQAISEESGPSQEQEEQPLLK
jgi:Protein phosphatase 2C